MDDNPFKDYTTTEETRSQEDSDGTTTELEDLVFDKKSYTISKPERVTIRAQVIDDQD